MTDLLKWTVVTGEEVLVTLEAQAKAAGVANGAIVSLIGAVESCRISNMPAGNASDDIITDYEQPFELSGTGDITDGRVHLHVNASGEGNAAIHGHLHEAHVKTWFVNAYVIPS
jgi:uncharacterized protein